MGWYFPLMSPLLNRARIQIFFLVLPVLGLTIGLPALGAESPVDLTKFAISIKASKEISSKTGQISTRATVGESGRFCTYIYVLDIRSGELERLKSNPIENFEILVGSGTEFKDVMVQGLASIKSLCDGQKKVLTFKGKNALPRELGWKKPLKSGSYTYVAVLGFSNDPDLSKFAVPSRIVAVSDFVRVRVKV